MNFEESKPSKSDAYRTQNPGFIHVVYDAPISDLAKFLYGPLGIYNSIITWNSMCWNGVKPRFYAQVHENRIETNTPVILFPCCSPVDSVEVTYFDRIGAPFVPASCGTKYHLCGFVEMAGGVAATAPHPICNNAICSCCRTYVPGLTDAATFCKAANKARESFKSGDRLAPKIQTMEK